MFGFKKHCAICGADIEKGKEVASFGKHLCSQEHATEYKKKILAEEAKAPRRGGCCG